LEPIKLLFRVANAGQRAALGDGLARAFRLCRIKDPDLARDISNVATQSGNTDVALAFQRSSNDDDQSTRLPRTSDRELFAPKESRSKVRSLDRLRSTTYLSGTGASLPEPGSRKFDLPDPFAPVEIRTK
jgi:hypothetical protein